jgi:hypothetical protein
MTLEDLIAQSFRDGAEEITIRVSRYAADLKTPEAFQVIAKRRGQMGGPWGVAIRGNAAAALRAVLDDKPAAAADAGSVFD